MDVICRGCGAKIGDVSETPDADVFLTMGAVGFTLFAEGEAELIGEFEEAELRLVDALREIPHVLGKMPSPEHLDPEQRAAVAQNLAVLRDRLGTGRSRLRFAAPGAACWLEDESGGARRGDISIKCGSCRRSVATRLERLAAKWQQTPDGRFRV